MKKKSIKKSLLFIVGLILILSISLGSAILSSLLDVTGNTTIKENSWVIYFDSVRKSTDSVASSNDARITNNEKTRIEFSANLKEPGDFYEFTVYTVNDGTIDAMIDSIEKKELTEEQQKYLEYIVTYDNGKELKKCDPLDSNTRRRIKAIVRFKEGLDLDDYPKENVNLDLFFDIHYVQKDNACESQLFGDEKVLTINPNGGKYQNRTDELRIYLEKDGTYTIEEPTRFNYNFLGWTVTSPEENGTYTLDENEFTMGDEDVTIEAQWKEGSYVARIMNTYYESVQDAFDAVDTENWQDNTVYLIRNVSETPTNSAQNNFVFNLGGYTLTGTITNPVTGNIRLINGKVKADDEHNEAILNYGTVTMGTPGDGVQTENSISLQSKNVGIRNIKGNENQGKFYIYDGYIEAKVGLVGGYTDKEENYAVFSEHVSEKNLQRIYLIRNPKRAVAITETEGRIYYYNVQDAINSATENKKLNNAFTDNDYVVYAYREFEAAYGLSINEGSRIFFDLQGHDITTGENITNNGYFKITNSSEVNSRYKPAASIVNNGQLNIDNLYVLATADKAIVDNKGSLLVTKSTLQGYEGYAVDNKENGSITMDLTSTLKSETTYGLHNTSQSFNLGTGNTLGILNEGTMSISNTAKVHNSSNGYAVYNKGTFDVNGGEISDTKDEILVYNINTFNVNDGVLSSKKTTINDGIIPISEYTTEYIYVPNVNINGGTITSTEENTINSLNVTVNGGTITSENKSAIVATPKIQYISSRILNYVGKASINGGTINGKEYGVYTNEFTMTNGTINSEDIGARDFVYTYRINNNDYKINSKSNISGGTINATNNGLVSEHLTMSDGNINSTNQNGIVVNAEGTISGGTSTGEIYGVLNNGKLTIGSDDGNISSVNPEFVGGFYGLYIEGDETNFYDGVLKGQSGGYNGTITGTPTGAIIHVGTETINEEVYETKYISAYDEWLQVGENTYTSIDDASNAIVGEGTITVIQDANVTFIQRFLDENNDKTITLDLNGHTITTTQPIYNYSNVTITDSSQEKTGKIISTRTTTLINELDKTLNIDNITINITSSTPAIENNGTMTIENANIKASSKGIINYNNLTINNINIYETPIGIHNHAKYINNKAYAGKIIINDGTINATDTAFLMSDNSNGSNGKITINNGTITGTNNAIRGTYGNIEINDGTISSTLGSTINTTYYNTIVVNGGNISSTEAIGIESSANITINDGTISGITGIKNLNTSDRSIIINNGHIIGTEENGIELTGNSLNVKLYVYGGVVEGTTNGIYSTGRVQIGRDDETINVDSPSVIGHTYYGLFTENYSAFYDGTLKGKTDGYHGLISIIPDGSLIKDDYEYINKLEYQTDYLITKGNWLKVDNQEFNSINKASKVIDEIGTMTVIADAYIDFSQTIPTGKTITLDLNGHSLIMTQPITTKGELIVVNSKDNGGISNLRDNVFLNQGKTTIEAGIFRSDTTSVIKNTANFILNGGTIQAPKMYGVENTSTFTMNGGTITSEDNSAIYNQNGTSTINGGEITAEKNYGIYQYSGIVNVKDGTITSNLSTGIYENGYYSNTSLNVSGGEVIGKTYGITTSYYNTTLNISGGHIVGQTESGIQTNTNTNITGGNIEGEKYGLHVNDSTSYLRTVNLGTNDGSINIDTPILKGELYGLYISYGTVNFYDGIIKGITNRHSGIIASIASHAQIFEDEEIIDRKNYYTEYLVTETEIAINEQTGETYGNLQEAIDEAESNETVKLLSNIPLYYELLINNKPNVTLDLNGKTISTNKKIVNNVPFKITNSSNEEALIKISTSVNLFTNNSELTIENVTLKNNSSQSYVINNQNKLTVNNAKIDCLNAIENHNEVTINNTTITATRLGISNTGKLTINGGTYSCTTNSSNYYSIYSNSNSTNVIDGATISGMFYNSGESTTTFVNGVINGNLQNYTGTLEINNSEIKNGKITNTGSLSINNSTYKATIGGNYNYSPEVAIVNSNTITLDNTQVLVNTEEAGRHAIAITNTGTLNINNESLVKIGVVNTTYDYKGIQTTASGRINIDNSEINVQGGLTSYGIYVNGDNAKATITTGKIDVEKATTAYGVYTEKGTFEMGHYEGTGYEHAQVSTTNPLIYVQGNSRGIGVKKTNGSFNFYDGIIRASKYAKPETTTNVEYQYEVTTYVDENTGFEYAVLEWMQNDYQGDTVALLNGVYYKTVQEAIDKAEAGAQITLLRSVSEDLTVPLGKNVKINLNKHSITTEIINSGTLNVFNGSLQNFDKSAVINYGTFIMGEDDSRVSNTSIRVISESTTIRSTGTLIIYDGYIEGITALEGKVDQVAAYARIRTEKDENLEKKYIQSLSQEAILSGETDLLITIDPASGYYEDSKEIKEVFLKHGESYELSTPTKNGCIFLGWEISDENAYDDSTHLITVDLSDITVTAKWEVSEDAVAKIGEDYYTSLQDALNNAEEGNLVELFKNVTENVTNRSNVTLDLGGKTVTGAFINQGELKILNGVIENTNGIGLENRKSLTLGENDGEIQETIIQIIGTTIGLQQDGKFNFYDGFIEGDVALSGKIDNVPQGYFLYNDHNSIKDCQRVYLIGNPANAVAVIENGGTQFFFNLQDAIDTAALTGSTVFIARNFEGTYPITIPSNTEININMSAYDITLGNDITINGTLNLFDASEDKIGSVAITKTITNKGTLNINKVNINQNNTTNAAITNTGNLNLTNTTITSKNGYTINTSGDANLQVGENVVLTATGNYVIYNNQNNPLEINTGKITGGINNLKELTIGGDIEVKGNGRYAVYMSAANSKFTMNNGRLEANTHVIYMSTRNIDVTINDGYIKGTNSTYVIYDGYNSSNENYKSSLTINGGIIDSDYHGLYLYANNFTMNGGEIRATYINSNQPGVYALYCASYSSCTINEGSKIIGYNASAIYKESNSKDMNINGATIITKVQSGYGVYNSGGNINISNSIIEATGNSSYGIYYYSNGSKKNVTLDNVDINSGNIGVYVTTSDNQSYESTLTVNSGTIYGDTYGIQQANQYTTVTIGTPESESQDNPYIRGKLYGIYKTAGVTNFYSGKLGGATYGYNDEIDNITTKKEITEDNIQDDLEIYTVTTTDHANVAQPQTPKEGNGYARVTYIDEDNGVCENNQSYDFNYTGREQSLLVPCSGKYKLEVWGAQGGSYSETYPGGYGGYSKGEITLVEGNTLYINVGGQGVKINANGVPAPGGYNGGGGVELTRNSSPLGTGGGATHIATTSGLLSTLENNIDSILIVAGGGGGSDDSNRAASGGGYRGGNASRAKGGSQTIGGATTNGYDTGSGKFGHGGGVPANYGTAIGYGGGGFYGGGSDDNGGGGGSGYTGNPLLTNTEMYGYNVPTTQVDYIINYLIDKEKFLKVGNNEYSSFEEAIDYIDDNLDGTGTIELLKDTAVQTSVTIPSTNNIIFDLVGHTLTMTTSITNKGTFNIVDSSDEKTGTINNTNTNAIINQKDLTITNGTISTTKKNAININNSSSKTTIQEGVKITGNNSAIIVTGASSELTITNAELTAATYGIYLNTYNIKLDLVGTSLNATNGSALYDAYTNNNGKNNITITGGAVEGITYGIYLNYSNITTQNTTIKTTSSNTSHYALNMNTYSPLVTINEGTRILSPQTSAVRLNCNLTMNGGEIKAEGTDSTGLSFYDSPGGAITANIYGGSIYGKKIGILQRHDNITTTIGNKDEEMSQEIPLIEGGEYAIHKEFGKTNFYSGRIKGIKNSYKGEFTKIRTKKSIYTMDEIIDEENPEKTIKVSYLVDTEGFLELDGTIYNNFIDAIDAINGTGTIKVLNDKLAHEAIEIPVGKVVILDLNNHKITMSQTITNYSTLVIKDDSDEKGGIIQNVNENAIENNSMLTISNVMLQSSKSVIYGKSGAGTITINDAKIAGNNGIDLNSAQILNISNSSVKCTTKGINLSADNTILNIEESTISGGTYGIYTYGLSNELTITDSNINSSSGSAIFDERTKNSDKKSDIKVTNVTITSLVYGIYTTSAELNVTNVTINNQSNSKISYGIYCNTGSTCKINEGTMINSKESSGIYVNAPTTIKGTQINSSGDETYGIYVNGSTLDISDDTKINTNGLLSYGIHADQSQTTITINDADIHSKNIGIYLGNTKTDTKTLTINHGSVVGETYGIYQTSPNATTTIGNLEETNSIENPHIEGGLISIKKDAGLLNFYSGRLKGYLKGNPGTIDYVRDGYEIFEDSDEIQLYLKNNRTISTSEVLDTPTENTAKQGNGYAKITYIEKENDSDTNYSTIEEIKRGQSYNEVYEFSYTGAIQEIQIVNDGMYKIETWGAQGGNAYTGYGGFGGKGAYSVSYVDLSSNTTLKVLVGQQGGQGNYTRGIWFGSGGGGGTFVSTSGNEPLCVAGGGGGGVKDSNKFIEGYPALATESGGGQNNGIGYGGKSPGSSGGGGFYGNGSRGSYGNGGIAFINGGTFVHPTSGKTTATNDYNIEYNAFGGFGGGASTHGSCGGGAGGGGYTGGSGNTDCTPGYGGGSYHTGNDSTAYSGAELFLSPDGEEEKGHSGNGYARITYIEGTSSSTENYVITLSSDYGTISESELIYNSGDQLGNIPQPILDNNMSFDGWYLNRKFTKKVTENTIVNGTATLYAKVTFTDDYCNSIINSTSEYDYTGSEESFEALCPGKYKLEVWGAQGGNSSYNSYSNTGGYGGYSKGIISLKRNEIIYITVGGKGGSATYTTSPNKIVYDGATGYNGGGYGTYNNGNSAQGGGGGATHIATVHGNLSNLYYTKKSVLIVAGGGGGAITSSTGTTFSGDGGSGGGLVGGSAIPTNDNCYNYGTGGTQTSVGTYKACSVNGSNNRDSTRPQEPSFGSGSNYSASSNSRYYAGGGAGWYGGQSGYRGPGGGGSGYVGNSRLSDTIMYGYNIDTYYDEDITNIAYLVENTEFVKNTRTNQTYLNLQTAIDSAEEDDTLQLIADSNISYDVMLVDGKKITIDFNGHNIATSKTITNNGNLIIINSDNDNTSTITNNISMALIENNGVLDINNLSIKAYIGINNTLTGKVDLIDSNINATNQGIVNEGLLNINSSTIYGTTYGIYSNSTRTDTITGSTIGSTQTAFYKYNLGKTTITNTTINGQINNNKTGAVLEITGGRINGLTNNSGNTTIKNANIEYNSNINNTEYQIRNSGLLTLQENTIKYKNYTFNTSGYQHNNVLNTGTLTSNDNEYINEYNYSNANNYNTYRYKNLYIIQNQGILYSIDDSYEAYGGSYAYGIYNNSTNQSTVIRPTIKLHNNNYQYGFYNTAGNMRFEDGTIEVYNGSQGIGVYTTGGTPTINDTNINIHDNSSTSYGLFTNSGTTTYESGTVSVRGNTVYGAYNNSTSATLVLGIEDGSGTDAADVSTTNPHIEAIGTSTGIGVRMGDGSFNYFDGYITGSTSPRGQGDITSRTDKNYQVVTKHNDETGYDYCILEFIK